MILKRLIPVILIAIVLGTLLFLRVFHSAQWVERLTELSLDAYQQIQPIALDAERQGIDPLFIAIDEVSMNQYGQWPWDRDVFGSSLIALYEQGASVVALDILFAEPDRLSPHQLKKRFPGLADALKLEEQVVNDYGYHNFDEFFADVLSQTPSVIAIAATGQPSTLDYDSFAIAEIGPVDQAPVPEGDLTGPISQLAANAALGHVSVIPGIDKVVRSVPSLVRSNGRLYPSLALATLARLQGSSTILVKAVSHGDFAAIEQIKVGDIIIPTADDGSIRIASQPVEQMSARTMSFSDAVSGDFSERLSGRVLIVGASAAGLGDIHSMVNAANVAGPLIHVNLLQQIASGVYFQDTTDAMTWSILIGTAAAIVAPILVFWMPPLAALAAFCVVIAGLSYGAWVAYVNSLILMDWLWMNVLAAATFFTALGYRIVVEESQKRFITGAFSTYLSPDVVKQLASEPDRLSLGGESKNLSILFADIRGFTAISEYFKDRPEQLAQLLNRLLTPLTYDIQNAGGTVDKYMGDAIMAFWNAPLDDVDDALHACQAALAMVASCAEVNRLLKAEDLTAPDLKIGIGINKGICTVGNLGSDVRFDYSCVGDPVNLAARLEGVTKKYGVNVVISLSVVEAMSRDRFQEFGLLIPLDRVIVVGKSEPVEIFTMLPHDTEWGALATECFQAVDQRDAAKLLIAEDRLSQSEAPDQIKRLYQDRVKIQDFEPRSLDSK
ncbi:adenylate/guanylate cyclase domain-containing protein [Litoricolaceae bacterium]|nr:adenylate/guanylate cyclase domain-containing protein [Litorivicinaceae bacterium]